MKQISIRELKAKISSNLLKEEFEITNRNVPIGSFIPKLFREKGRLVTKEELLPKVNQAFVNPSVNPGASSEAVPKVRTKKEPLQERAIDKGFVLCEHGTPKSLCKKCMLK